MSMNIGLTGLKAATTHLDVVSNNVANASTTGFKSGRAVFGDLVDPNAGESPGLGVKTQAINQQFLQGGTITTGNALDLAINGSGFFVVKDDTGTSYTRAGSFHVDKDGYIVNNLDQRLQGTGGDLQLTNPPVTNIAIDKNGNITAKDNTGADIGPIGPIALVNFPNVQGLKNIGDTQWVATPEAGAPSALAERSQRACGAGDRQPRLAVERRPGVLQRRNHRATGRYDHRPARFSGQRADHHRR